MTDLDEFVTARLDEDEAAAKAAHPGPWIADLDDVTDENVTDHGGQIVAWVRARPMTDATRSHIARWDPARVLAEVALWRSLIEDYRIVMANNAIEKFDGNTEVHAAVRDLIAKTLWMMLRRGAATWSDHPDFKPEWRIDG